MYVYLRQHNQNNGSYEGCDRHCLYIAVSPKGRAVIRVIMYIKISLVVA